MQIKAQWKLALFGSADATTVANEIKSIGDEVTPQQIVEYAKDQNTELHKCFTWENTVAAEKWRLHEARQVVCQLKIVKVDGETEEPTPIRFFYKTDNKDGYKPTEIILKNENEYTKLLFRVKNELQAIRNKHKNLTELESVWDAIDEL